MSKALIACVGTERTLVSLALTEGVEIPTQRQRAVPVVAEA